MLFIFLHPDSSSVTPDVVELLESLAREEVCHGNSARRRQRRVSLATDRVMTMAVVVVVRGDDRAFVSGADRFNAPTSSLPGQTTVSLSRFLPLMVRLSTRMIDLYRSVLSSAVGRCFAFAYV